MAEDAGNTDQGTQGAQGGAAADAGAATPRTFTEQELQDHIGRAVGARDEQLLGPQGWITTPQGIAWLQSRGLTVAQAKEVVRETAQQGGDAEEGFDAWLAKQPKSVRERLGAVVQHFDGVQAGNKYAQFQSRIEGLAEKLPLGAKDSSLRAHFIRDAMSRVLDYGVAPENAVQMAHKELEEALGARDRATTERAKKERLARFVTPAGQAGAAGRKEPENWEDLEEEAVNVHKVAFGKPA